MTSTDRLQIDNNLLTDSPSNSSVVFKKVSGSLSDENSMEKANEHSLENLVSNKSLTFSKKRHLVKQPNLKRFKNVFRIWLNKFLIPLYKILLNFNDRFKEENKEKIKILKKLIEEILQTQNIEYFANASSFEFDTEATTTIFSFLERNFEKVSNQLEQKAQMNIQTKADFDEVQNINLIKKNNAFF